MKLTKLTIIVALTMLTQFASAQITEIGLASFYADKFDGKTTASGEIFKQNKMTAAHRTLPFGTVVKVTNLDNNLSVEVTINDRGPFVEKRIIDLSKAAAEKLKYVNNGTASVKVEVVSLPENASVQTAETSKNASSTPAWPGSKKSEPEAEQQPAVEQPASSGDSQTRVTEVSAPANEYFKIESTRISPKGFGVQLASYQEAANLVKRCAEIKEKVGKDIMIQIGDKNGVKVYRIIAGPFETREKAEHFNSKLDEFSGSFIVTLD